MPPGLTRTATASRTTVVSAMRARQGSAGLAEKASDGALVELGPQTVRATLGQASLAVHKGILLRAGGGASPVRSASREGASAQRRRIPTRSIAGGAGTPAGWGRNAWAASASSSALKRAAPARKVWVLVSGWAGSCAQLAVKSLAQQRLPHLGQRNASHVGTRIATARPMKSLMGRTVAMTPIADGTRHAESACWPVVGHAKRTIHAAMESSIGVHLNKRCATRGSPERARCTVTTAAG